MPINKGVKTVHYVKVKATNRTLHSQERKRVAGVSKTRVNFPSTQLTTACPTNITGGFYKQ